MYTQNISRYVNSTALNEIFNRETSTRYESPTFEFVSPA